MKTDNNYYKSFLIIFTILISLNFGKCNHKLLQSNIKERQLFIGGIIKSIATPVVSTVGSLVSGGLAGAPPASSSPVQTNNTYIQPFQAPAPRRPAPARRYGAPRRPALKRRYGVSRRLSQQINRYQ